MKLVRLGLAGAIFELNVAWLALHLRSTWLGVLYLGFIRFGGRLIWFGGLHICGDERNIGPQSKNIGPHF